MRSDNSWYGIWHIRYIVALIDAYLICTVFVCVIWLFSCGTIIKQMPPFSIIWLALVRFSRETQPCDSGGFSISSRKDTIVPRHSTETFNGEFQTKRPAFGALMVQLVWAWINLRINSGMGCDMIPSTLMRLHPLGKVLISFLKMAESIYGEHDKKYKKHSGQTNENYFSNSHISFLYWLQRM